jgi:L-threonylcarbamoyladenylate synthase
VNTVVTGGLNTIGLRSPQHPVAQAVLKSFNGGIAAPSANRFGRISPTSAADVYKDLHNRLSLKLDLILDGGPCPIGIESTIVDLSQSVPHIIRLGAISSSQLKKVLGKSIEFSPSSTVRAPGTLAKHYAPQTTTRLVPSTELKNTIDSYLDNQQQLVVLAYSKPLVVHPNVCWLQMPNEPKRYAQQLYTQLRKADELNCTHILIEQAPEKDVWAAINDRLSKAAAR